MEGPLGPMRAPSFDFITNGFHSKDKASNMWENGVLKSSSKSFGGNHPKSLGAATSLDFSFADLEISSKQEQEPATPGRVGDAQRPPLDRNILLVPPRKRLRQSVSTFTCAGGGGAGRARGPPPSDDSDDSSDQSASSDDDSGPSKGYNRSQRPRNNDNGNGGSGGDEDEDGSYDDDQAGGVVEIKIPAIDTQCSWCDDGGFLLACDGRCRRAFHIGIERDEDECLPGQAPVFKLSTDGCNVLSLEPELAEALVTSSIRFLCPSCLSKNQLCWYCGKIGTDGLDDPNQGVRKCVVATCGRFYHESCLQKGRKKLAGVSTSTMPRVCPLHWCKKCRKQELKDVDGKQELVQCRRCPKAWHQSCIPDELYQKERVWIAERDEDGNLAPGSNVETSLVYCMDHKVENGVAEQERGMFLPEDADEWHKKYAQLFPHLACSRALLEAAEAEEESVAEEEEEEVEEERAAKGAKVLDTGPLSLATVRTTTYDMARRHVRHVFHSAAGQVQKADIRRQLRQPIPYQNPLKKSVDKDVLADLEDTMRYADQQQRAGVHNSLTTIVTKDAIRDIARWHNDMTVMLAPYMRADRYSSYGRHFTQTDLLRIVVSRLMPFLNDRDIVVDFSCGKNEFIPLVKAAALDENIIVQGRAYDIITAKDLTDFVLKSWFEANPKIEGLDRPDRLVIGLNPPFGFNNELANMFVNHAAKLNPRVMVYIVPPSTDIPRGYKVVYEDRQCCRGEVFYVPGIKKRSWNKEAPALRILLRSDWDVFSGDRRDGNWRKISVPR